MIDDPLIQHAHDAYQLGRLAFNEGRDDNANPYPWHMLQFCWWENGWNDGFAAVKAGV